MTTFFWSNTIWFIALGLLTVIQLAIALCKSKSKKHTLAFYFIAAGFTFSIEATIAMFLKAYNYHPMIFPQWPMDDLLAGNLFSQFSIVASAALIAVLDLKYFWLFLFAVIYSGISELFLAQGLYEQYWYQTWMTLVGFAILFFLFEKLYRTPKIYTGGWRYFFMFFGLFTLQMPTIFWSMRLAGVFTPNFELVPDGLSSYAIVSLVNLILVSVACMYIYFKKGVLLARALVAAALFGTICLGYVCNWYTVAPGWLFGFIMIDVAAILLAIFIMDRLTRYPPDFVN